MHFGYYVFQKVQMERIDFGFPIKNTSPLSNKEYQRGLDRGPVNPSKTGQKSME